MTSDTPKAFSSFPIRGEILQSLEALGYARMTPIQALSASAILDGQDVLAQAETGSGKTAAFAIGLLQRLTINLLKTQALVICPTRELADQVAAQIRRLASALPNTRVITLCGGKPMHDQLTSLKVEPHVVVGTPGRLRKHLGKGTLRLENVRTLVLDEADRMLDMGFYEDIMFIIDSTESDRQTLLFSATYSPDIIRISESIQRQTVKVSVEPSHTNMQIEQLFIVAPNEEKLPILLKALNARKPENALIFCNMKHQVHTLCSQLSQHGLVVAALHGDLEQHKRDEALILFANRSISYLVATDVAARGIDINELAAVINYDLTPDAETYTHRIGRTGRAGCNGIAITLVDPDEIQRLRTLEDYLHKTISFTDLKKDVQQSKVALMPPMRTLLLRSGKKDKIRPGDIVGALTASAELSNNDIGKITVLAKVSYVAVTRKKSDLAMRILKNGRIKKQKVRVTLVA